MDNEVFVVEKEIDEQLKMNRHGLLSPPVLSDFFRGNAPNWKMTHF